MEHVFAGELEIIYPETFRVMSNEEQSQLNILGAPPVFCLKDADRHMIITAGLKKPGLLGGMISVDSAVRELEKRIRTPMSAYGYKLEDFHQHLIDGESVTGFRYRYTAQDIRMCGESCIVKHKGVLYYLHVYLREELEAESWPVWENILSSSKWK